jgi:biotin carboxylase
VGQALGLPAVPPAAAAAARDKRLMREALAKAGVPQPEHAVYPLRTDAARIAREVALPVVVKPLLLSGSRGVMRADSVPELRAALGRLRALLESPALFELKGPSARQVLVERFVAGAEVSVEGLVQEGELDVLAIFDKPDPLEGPFFEETLYVTPSRHPRSVQAAVRRVTADAVAALGVRSGPVHAELRLAAEGPVVIEVALRTIGGLCARALRFGMGLSLEELVIANALGRRPPSLERERRAAGVMMLPIPKAGTLRGVHGLDEARAVPGVEDVVITIRKGRVLVPLPEGSEYLGFAFARGDRPEDVEKALRAAHACLKFDVAKTVVARPVSRRA